MSNAGNIVERVLNWLSTGTPAEVFIRKALLIAAAILIIYRLGYAVGKLLFHLS